MRRRGKGGELVWRSGSWVQPLPRNSEDAAASEKQKQDTGGRVLAASSLWGVGFGLAGWCIFLMHVGKPGHGKNKRIPVIFQIGRP